jgi:hypothetical protein
MALNCPCACSPPWKEPGASYFNIFYMKFLGNKMADFEFRGVPIVEIQMPISKKLQVSSSANKQKCERWVKNCTFWVFGVVSEGVQRNWTIIGLGRRTMDKRYINATNYFWKTKKSQLSLFFWKVVVRTTRFLYNFVLRWATATTFSRQFGMA